MAKVRKDHVAILPASVVMTFPIRIGRGDFGKCAPTNDVWVEQVFLPEAPDFIEDLSSMGDVAGFDFYKVFHNTAIANKLTEDAAYPSNLADLRTLANLYAAEYWSYIYYANHDMTYAGVVDWEPEGLSDFIEWTCEILPPKPHAPLKGATSGPPNEGRIVTRIARPPWNQNVEELLHLGTICQDDDSVPSAYPSGYGSGVQGLYCVDFMACDCTCKSLHSNFPIWVQSASCANPSGGTTGTCGAGTVDTGGFSPCQCDAEVWTFEAGSITDGTDTSGECVFGGGLQTLTFDSLTNTWKSAVMFEADSFWVLEYFLGTYRLRGPGALYTLDGLLWNCEGPNTLTQTVNEGVCTGFPENITVTKAS